MMVGVFALTVKGDIENQREVEACQRFTSVIIFVDSNIRAASPQKSQGMNNPTTIGSTSYKSNVV